MKKGFTLVELLAVIVILSLLALIVGVGVTKITKRAKEDLTHAQELAILDAAEVWTASNISDLPSSGCVAVSINELIESGAIGELEMDSYTNVDKDSTVIRICSELSNAGNNTVLNYELTNISDSLSCFGLQDVTGGVSITGYSTDSSCPKDVIIPKKIGNKDVVEIGNQAFFMMELTSVVIPNTVETIGELAFFRNNLTSINIPDSVTSILSSAFGANYLTSVKISNGLTSLPSGVFSQNKLKSVTIPEGITSIGSHAFNGNELTSINIPDSVTSIYSNAFSENKLTTVRIPRGVVSIDLRAFAYNRINNLDLSGADSLNEIGTYAFEDNFLTSVNIPNSVTTIGGWAFDYNRITKVTIGSGIETIDQFAFSSGSQNEVYGITYGPNNINSVVINAPESQVDYENAFSGFTGTIQFTG